MSIMLPLNPLPSSWDFIDDMAGKVKGRKQLQPCNYYKYHRSHSDHHIDKSEKSTFDDTDNPQLVASALDSEHFNIMKYEINRLNSYTGKWPLTYVKPAQLAENGFFYLQSEDKVQCAFCHVVIEKWTVGQSPVKEHIRKSPRCPLLLSTNTGNVTLAAQKPEEVISKVAPEGKSKINSSKYKPKNPRMADLKERLMTYKDWPLIMLSSKQLAECGLYYTGVADVVTCFFCGGSLGNWDLTDDPFNEHTKFFPHCSYLSLIKRRGESKNPAVAAAPVKSMAATTSAESLNSLGNEVVLEASLIFSKPLVQEVLQYLRDNGRRFSSLNDLCEAVLEYKEIKNSHGRMSLDVTGHTNNEVLSSVPEKIIEQNETAAVFHVEEPSVKKPKEVKDALLCKICMDREMGVVFQPCGHLVACPKCAQVIFNCPLCRSPVTSKVRTYLS